MVSSVYANGRLMWAGWVSCLVGIAITTGEVVGGAAVKPLGHMKIQAITVMVLATLFLGRKYNYDLMLG